MAQNIDFKKLIPNYLRNEVITGLSDNLFNKFTSSEDSIFVTGSIGQPQQGKSEIQQASLERQENALTPGFYFKYGPEETVNVFNDLVNRLGFLNCDISQMKRWMAEQNFNFSPPIDYDKFVNFTNYYWVGNFTTSNSIPWNPDRRREYYVIQRPKANDSNIKMPVRLATTRPIALWANDRAPETFTITFTSDATFEIDSDIAPGQVRAKNSVGQASNPISGILGDSTRVVVEALDGTSIPSLSDSPGDYYDILEFTIQNGNSSLFSAGDTITISVVHFTSQITVTASSINLTGKGAVTGVIPQSRLMDIDGVLINPGDRILVKDQIDSSENGIYIVAVGRHWDRALDSTLNEHFTVGQTIEVEEGETYGGSFIEVTSKTGGSGELNPIDANIQFGASSSTLKVNAWQRFNFWVHRDDLFEYEALGVNVDTALQAQRPIIEYNNTLQLNAFFNSSGAPCDELDASATPYNQIKTQINQIPLFDIYRYDGTHANIISGIWYYKESTEFPVDSQLFRRVEITPNSDYVFSQGLKDDRDRILYFKNAGNITSIWRAGVAGTTVTSIAYTGEQADSQNCNILSLNDDADPQNWTVEFINATTAKISGTRSGYVGDINVGQVKTFDDFTLQISVSTTSYSAGNKFAFRVRNRVSPRFIKSDNGEIVNYPFADSGFSSGYEADQSLDVPEGAWLTPVRLYQNVIRQNNSDINFADFVNHARSVLRNQDGFVGSSFGNNNSRNIGFNSGYGGRIREFDSNMPLLISMLQQESLSPLAILDFAEQQYQVAISSVDQYIAENLVGYLSGLFPIPLNLDIDPFDQDIQILLGDYEKFRKNNTILETVFSDSTASIANWPVTLPMIGLSDAIQPMVAFDKLLEQEVIVHHDGHFSPLATENSQFNRDLAKVVISRSDGTAVGGIISNTLPSSAPYARQLWFQPSTGRVFVFAVEFDATDIPVGTEDGQRWFNRATGVIRIWNNSAQSWTVTNEVAADRWVRLAPENVRNSLLLAVENKLFNSVHQYQHLNYNLDNTEISNSSEMALELARYASKYNLDPTSTDFDENDAFTWNYNNADFPLIGTGFARWNDAYKAYYAAFGADNLFRVDLEPWKLATPGFPASQTMPTGWDLEYINDVQPSNNIVNVKTAATNNISTPLMGLQEISGYQTSPGDRVLLVGQLDATQNGIYVVSSSGWSRSIDALTTQLSVNVSSGNLAGAIWVLTTPGMISPSITPIQFQIAKKYKQHLWDDIRAANPGILISVNENTDELLPPYVVPSDMFSANALMQNIPAGIDNSYEFGDNGPIESTWKKSIEYLYGLARSAFKLDPLRFLDKTWGETYTIPGTSNLRVERSLQRSLPHTKFLLHGEKLNLQKSIPEQEVINSFSNSINGITWNSDFSGTVQFIVSHVASSGEVSILGQSLGKSGTVFDVFVNGEFVTHIIEGQQFSFSHAGVYFDDVGIYDRGIPFNLGDELRITFEANIITSTATPIAGAFRFGFLGCRGCVSPGTPDEIIVVSSEQIDPVFSFIPAKVQMFKGLGQIFTNAIRFKTSSKNATASELVPFREWDIKLTHRLGAMVRPSTLSIDVSGGQLPDTAYSTIIKKSKATDDIWLGALRIQLLSIGSRKTLNDGFYAPKTDGADWVFRIEGYNPANPTIEINKLDTSGEFLTFNVLDRSVTDTTWKRYSKILRTEKLTLPLQVTGIQNVLDIVFGYASQLEEKNVFGANADTSSIDAETGRLIDWQLEAEKFIRSVYAGMDAGTAEILNPYAEKFSIETPRGILGRYSNPSFIDAATTQACFDVIGGAVPLESLSVLRTDEVTTTYSRTPIYSAHVYVDEYEHAIVFNQKFSDDNNARSVFDQFLGQWIPEMYLEYFRQSTPRAKPTFDGYVLSNNNVNRNVVSSIDAVQNAYDSTNTFLDPEISRHALSLIGFESKDYFRNLGINRQTELDFWKAMINAKGTNLSVDAFTQFRSFSNAKVDEFWAVKIAEYGDFREKTMPEIKIGPQDTVRQYLSLQFYDKADPNYSPLSLFTQIEALDDSRWFTLDDLGTTLRFDAKSISETVEVADGGTQYTRLKNIYHNGDDMSPTVSGPSGAEVINANTLKTTQPGTYIVSGFTWLNPSKLSPIKLFDYVNRELETQIGLWHPAVGIHAFSPLELINITSKLDPASYNYSTKTEDNETLMLLKPWGEREVGRVWWDQSNLGYTPYYDASIFPSRENRNSRWGALAEWASIDLYEWTKSPVHPSEYDVLASAQEGNSSIPQAERLSGRVGLTNYYKADRVVTRKAIAWSKGEGANANAHPAFGLAAEVRILNANNNLIADQGRLSDIQLTAGRRFGGWDTLANKPVGEVIIGSNVGYYIGSSVTLDQQIIASNTAINNITYSAEVQRISNSSVFGTKIGSIALTSINDSANTILRMVDEVGNYEDVIVRDWASSRLPLGDSIIIKFETFGLQVKITATTSTSTQISANDLCSLVTQDGNDIYIREYVNYIDVIPLSDLEYSNESVFSAGPTIAELGWRAWDIPTQQQLNRDLPFPKNEWRPYLGDDVPVIVTPDIIDQMKSGNTWTLSNGIVIDRFKTTWSPWQQLQDISETVISNGQDPVSFTFEDVVESNRLSIYINGVQVAPSQIIIIDSTATLSTIVPEGHTIYMLYRKFVPSTAQLAFNPDVEEDFEKQTRYKKDYDYTELDVRDSAGNKTDKVYYFWVKNKTVPSVGKNISLQQASNILRSGETSFVIFARMLPDEKSQSGASFDSCSIAGLNYRVTQNNTYKLRFLRDFTLRDDPEELKLKNTHTEWALIRERQNTRIPRTLWESLTNAICGADRAGNTLPAPNRVQYDQVYGTRTRYGTKPGQIFVDSDLALATLVQTVLNTSLTIDVGVQQFTDYITMFNITNSTTEENILNTWFSNPGQSRQTMDMIYATARPQQVNEIFFQVLNDALSNNFEFEDIFKTSLITVNSSSRITQQNQTEQVDEFY